MNITDYSVTRRAASIFVGFADGDNEPLAAPAVWFERHAESLRKGDRQAVVLTFPAGYLTMLVSAKDACVLVGNAPVRIHGVEYISVSPVLKEMNLHITKEALRRLRQELQEGGGQYSDNPDKGRLAGLLEYAEFELEGELCWLQEAEYEAWTTAQDEAEERGRWDA